MSACDEAVCSSVSEECFVYPVLQEFSPQSKLLSLIPAQAQRGLFTTDINFTCVDVAEEYIAIGSNVGIVYLYNRKKDKLHKLRNDDYSNSITRVKLLISLECLVVFGSRNGLVMAFKVPFNEKLQIEKFTVDGLHKASVTALEWAKNGMKFFSGDSNGVVVCTDVEHLEHQSRSYVVVDESNEIVQLSYSKRVLSVSTLQRSVLYLFEHNKCLQVGQKDRKCSGKFGATFFTQGDSTLFACRPGQRIWKSDSNGVILETMILKNALSQPHPKITLLRSLLKNNQLMNFQFGPIKTFNNAYLITWSVNSVVVIDPMSRAVVASCCDLNSIVDIATNNDEILILQGLRHLIRIAVSPEESESTSLPQNVVLPPRERSSSSVEKEQHLLQEVNDASNIFGWLQRKFSDNSQASEENQLFSEKSEDSSVGLNELPDIIKLDLKDSISIRVDDGAPQPVQENSNLSKDDIFCSIEKTNDIVFKRKKKKKEKLKKVRFADGKTSKSKSIEVVNSDFESKAGPIYFQHTEHTKELSTKNKEDETISGDKMESIENASIDVVGDISNIFPEEDTSTSLTCLPEQREQISQAIVAEVKFKADDDILLKSILNKYSQLQNDETNESNISEVNIQISEAQQSDHQSESDMSEKLEMDNDSPNVSINIDKENITLNTKEEPSSPDGIYSKPNFVNPISEVNLAGNLLLTEVSLSRESDINESPLSESFPSLETPENNVPKYGVDFVQYNAPGSLISLSISDSHIFCVDNRNKVYFSNFSVFGFKWKELCQPGEQVAVSASEFIVWILYKGTVFAPRWNPNQLWDQVEWVAVARDIVYIAVDESCGWYISSSGQLITQQHLSASHPYSYPESVSCSWNVTQIACRDQVVWILTTDNKLYFRTGITAKCVAGKSWKEIPLDPIESIVAIALGPGHVAWIVDGMGTIWFRVGVNPQMPGGLNTLWQVETSEYVYEYTDQIKKAVMKVFNADLFGSFIQRLHPVYFAASEAGLWYCKNLDNLLYSIQKTIIGHSWEAIIPIGTSSATKWNIVSAGGVFDSQGEVWCTTSTDELLCMSTLSRNPLAVELPSCSSLTCVESVPQSLWVLTSDGDIYIRSEISTNGPQGIWWQKLNLSQLCDVQLTHISCSADVVWACDGFGNVYLRLGPLNPSTGFSLEQAWVKVDSDLSSTSFMHKSTIGKKFPLPLIHPVNCKAITKVYVGPKKYMVWALDDKNNVYFRDGITLDLPLGEKWVMVPGPHAKQLCISKDAVWILKQSGKIYRRFGIAESNPVGDYWKLIPGKVSYLSATFDDDLWGIQDESLWYHNCFALRCTRTPERKLSSDSVSDDDWEDLMSSPNM